MHKLGPAHDACLTAVVNCDNCLVMSVGVAALWSEVSRVCCGKTPKLGLT